MPTYDFSCSSCGERFSRRTTIEGRKHVHCPFCDSSEVSQLLTGFLYRRSGQNGDGGGGAVGHS